MFDVTLDAVWCQTAPKWFPKSRPKRSKNASEKTSKKGRWFAAAGACETWSASWGDGKRIFSKAGCYFTASDLCAFASLSCSRLLLQFPSISNYSLLFVKSSLVLPRIFWVSRISCYSLQFPGISWYLLVFPIISCYFVASLVISYYFLVLPAIYH